MFSLFFLISCNNDNSSGGDDGDSPESAAEKKRISSRDFSINKANSYSTLFLDSLAMEKFIVEKKIPDSVRRRMRSFYNTRNYQYAWFSEDGLTEQAKGFWNLHDYHTTYAHDTALHDKALAKRMDNLITESGFSVSASNASFLQTELQLTQHFIQYMMGAYNDFIKRKEMERFVPFKKRDAMFIADSLIKKKHKDNKYFEDVNVRYGQLKSQLALYYNIASKSEWTALSCRVNHSKKEILLR
jgi:L,D-transpeptidase YcbB